MDEGATGSRRPSPLRAGRRERTRQSLRLESPTLCRIRSKPWRRTEAPERALSGHSRPLLSLLPDPTALRPQLSMADGIVRHLTPGELNRFRREENWLAMWIGCRVLVVLVLAMGIFGSSYVKQTYNNLLAVSGNETSLQVTMRTNQSPG